MGLNKINQYKLKEFFMNNCFKLHWIVIFAIVIGFSMLSCGNSNNPSEFVGKWELVRGDFPFDKAELFKDGTGIVDEGAFSWKVVDKRLIITHPLFAIACDYTVSETFITLIADNGEKGTFVNRSIDTSNLTMSNSLVGKWEFQTLIFDGEEMGFPNEYFAHGGVEYTRNGFTTYLNGESNRGLVTAYTKGNKIYYPTGVVGEWSIKSNTLTVVETTDKYEETVIARKVQKFSWE